MQIKVNGKLKRLESSVNILELLTIEQVKMPEMVSVEVNGEIVDREDFDKILIKENDIIEFLYFMGGGTIEFK